MSGLLYITPLVGWMYPFFQTMRSSMTSAASAVGSIVIGLCCLFIGINLIKVIIEMANDDQGSGFSDISLHSLIRPFIILAIIFSFPTIFGAFDTLVNDITISLVNAVPKPSEKSYLEVADKIDNYRKNLVRNIMFDSGATADEITQALDDDVQKQVNRIADDAISKNEDIQKMQTQLDSAKTSKNSNLESSVSKLRNPNVYGDNELSFIDGLRIFFQGIKDKRHGTDTIEETAELLETKEKLDNKKASIRENIEKAAAMSEKASDGMGLLATFVNWLFDKFYIVVQIFAEITLCVMAVLGPLTFGFCILPSYKDKWKEFVGKYIELSMWKVVAAIIMYLVCNARALAAEFNAARLYNYDGEGAIDVVPLVLTQALFAWAGIKALSNVSGIVTDVLNLATLSTSSQGGGIMAPITGGAKAVGKAGSKVAGAISGVNKSSSITKAVTKGINQSRI